MIFREAPAGRKVISADEYEKEFEEAWARNH